MTVTAVTPRPSSRGRTRTAPPTACSRAVACAVLARPRLTSVRVRLQGPRALPVGIYSAEATTPPIRSSTSEDLSSGKTGTMAMHSRERRCGPSQDLLQGLTKTVSFQRNGNILGTDIYVNPGAKGQLGPNRARSSTREVPNRPGTSRLRGARLFLTLGPPASN